MASIRVSPATATTVVAAAALVGIIAYSATLESAAARRQRSAGTDLLHVPVAPARLEDGFDRAQTFLGRIRPRRSSELGFELTGRVVEIAVDDGDLVEAGAVVAQLDTARIRAHLRELRAAVGQATASLDLARSTRERYERALEDRAVSAQAFDEAAREVTVRTAALDQAKAAVARIEVDLGKSTLVSPFRARVAARLADEGDVVEAGRTVVRLIEVDAPEARIGVSGRAVSRLEVGTRTSVQVEGQMRQGTIRAIVPVRSADTRVVEVVLQLDDRLGEGPQGECLRDGDLAELNVPQRQDTTGYWVPTLALTESARGLWALYVAADRPGGHTLERRQVQIATAEGDRVYIQGTLQPGELVVTGGIQGLAPGMLVTPRNTPEAGR